MHISPSMTPLVLCIFLYPSFLPKLLSFFYFILLKLLPVLPLLSVTASERIESN
ncbi:hypothetical protein K432DRAFT_116917 [Lepidopterella palustris CBS 459.81]|uniref:Uncharacterized protein n=1 Tax=Lepidopterella palustris CBS 459.81 TaxID=1314670 RepID=A0A8E2JCI2_9PEZI|nr:hypothetical protein K432DRAFT_116917 [Lepidopterella palustris CBS 459.81]